MLTFIRIYEVKKYRPYGLYQCECGGRTVTLLSNVRLGITRSCGCLRVKNCRALAKQRVKQ